jgi:cell wall-associated NlpC family hydrolase
MKTIKASAFLIETMRHCGVPYLWGGKHPSQGFDCSGFVAYCLRRMTVTLPSLQNSQGLFEHFLRDGDIIYDSYKLGDLLFFGKDVRDINHVAFAINDRLMLEAGGGGRETTNAEIARKQKAKVRLAPIRRRKDLIGCVRMAELIILE